jgi:hypothetical protein
MKTRWIWTLRIALALPVIGAAAWKIWHRKNEAMEEARRQAGAPRGIVPNW